MQTDFLGELTFTDGMPSEATVQKTYDFIDLSRAVDSFLNGIPCTSIYAMQDSGFEQLLNLTKTESLKMRTLCSREEWGAIFPHDARAIHFQF